MSADMIPHGDLVGYKTHKCPCPDCRQANRDYENERRRRSRAGLPTTDRVDGDQVRAHVAALQRAGVQQRQIADRARVSFGWLKFVLEGRPGDGVAPSRRVDAVSARRVLALPVPDGVIPTQLRVCGDGPRWRARALVAIGYPPRWQAAQLGMQTSHFKVFLMGSGRVRASRAHAIKALYDTYWDKPAEAGPGARAALAMAEEHGWPVPMGLEDDVIDLPVDQMWEELAVRARRLSRADQRRASKAVAEGDRSLMVVAAAEENNRVRVAERRARAQMRGEAA